MVEIPDGKLLRFTVSNYIKKNGKVIFIDERTNQEKDFPDRWCAIESMRGVEDERLERID